MFITMKITIAIVLHWTKIQLFIHHRYVENDGDGEQSGAATQCVHVLIEAIMVEVASSSPMAKMKLKLVRTTILTGLMKTVLERLSGRSGRSGPLEWIGWTGGKWNDFESVLDLGFSEYLSECGPEWHCKLATKEVHLEALDCLIYSSIYLSKDRKQLARHCPYLSSLSNFCHWWRIAVRRTVTRILDQTVSLAPEAGNMWIIFFVIYRHLFSNHHRSATSSQVPLSPVRSPSDPDRVWNRSFWTDDRLSGQAHTGMWSVAWKRITNNKRAPD